MEEEVRQLAQAALFDTLNNKKFSITLNDGTIIGFGYSNGQATIQYTGPAGTETPPPITLQVGVSLVTP